MRRASLHPPSVALPAPPASAPVSYATLAVSTATAGTKRPRTASAQADTLLLHSPPPLPSLTGKDQVVVGITAALGDELEDWSEDFEAHTPRTRAPSHAEDMPIHISESIDEREGSEGSSAKGLSTRMLRGFSRSTSTSLFHRSSRRSWQRQHSFDAGGGSDLVASDRASRRSHRIRHSSNDAADDSRRSSSNLGLPPTASSSSLTQLPNGTEFTRDLRDEMIIDNDDDDEDDFDDGLLDANVMPLSLAIPVAPEDRHESRAKIDEGMHEGSTLGRLEMGEEEDEDELELADGQLEIGARKEQEDEGDDEEDDEEDWDVEFGFADAPDDEQDDLKPGSSSVVDSNRRRADNFNIFLRGFHDMMAGDEFMDDDEESGRSRKGRHVPEESLFKRRRSDLQTAPSLDGNAEAVLRSSLSSLPGTTEYALVDKYRLLDVACSSSYAVRIERYPKPCATYSNLEREAATSSHFPSFSDNKLEQWLANVVRSKCEDVDALMTQEQANTPNPRNQKNHQFRTLVSLPFGKRFADKCFKQISVYRFYGEDKSNRELIRVFFEKLATAGIADEHWSSKLESADLEYTAGTVMEVLQEAARMYGPVPASGVMTPPSLHASASSSNRSNGATAFWMRQFQTILTICVDAFPTYRHLVALIELRFVCHHLVGLANSDLSYSWQVCNQYPHFGSTNHDELMAGEAAPIIANEILEYYGALLTALQADVEAVIASSEPVDASQDAVTGSSHTLVPSRFGTTTNPHCLFALAVCDLQAVYSSRSALAETMIPELVELFEFEEDEALSSFRDGDLPFARDSGHHEDEQVDEVSIEGLLKPSSVGRRRLLEETLYRAIDMFKEPLVKARCAAVMSSMHSGAAATAVFGMSPHAHMKLAESLAYEALRTLEWITSRRLHGILPLPESEDYQHREPVASVFANDGLLSDLGREILESLGNVLVKNQKYRYGILCLEAATTVYSLLNQGRNHERIDRLMCTLTTQAEDVKRALPLHEKVAISCLRQGNANEYVFLTQTLTNMWLREGKFSRAEEFLTSSFHFLRDQTGLLPPFFLSSLAGSHAGSDSLSNSSRSGTALTASSSASSSSGSFVYPGGRGNTSEMDLWLNHDITLHLLLRDLYRASGRFIEAMRVLEYLLNYSARLPRGKRTQLRMLLAEDSLQLRVLDTSRYMFHLLDQEANYFCDRLLQNTLGGVFGGANNSSSGGFGSSNGGSNSGGRSLGGMGSESRFSFDMVLSIRYILGRAKLYLHLGELRLAYTWLSLAHIKNERESVRTKAKMHMLDGRILVELLRRQHEQRLLPEKTHCANELHQHRGAPVSSVEDTLKAFTSSVYALSKEERLRFEARLTEFGVAVECPDKSLELGVQAYWSAYDQYHTLDDRHHQLKASLGVIQCQLVPIERSFFALGSNASDEQLMKVLGACAVVPRRSSTFVGTKDGEVPPTDERKSEGKAVAGGDDDTTIEGVRTTLQDCQRLLRQALSLCEQLAEPSSYFQTLVYCAQTWTWLERLAPYKGERAIKEAGSFWEEAVKVMKAVYFRRVAFEYDPRNRQSIQQVARTGGLHGPSLGGDSLTFSLVPILNFRESFILRLESVTLQLITTACQLQQFDRVPEYVEDLLVLHMDELLSARMCLNGIAHQLRSFRSQQQHQSIVRQIPLYSIPGPTAYSTAATAAKSAGIDIAVPPNPRPSFSSNSVPGVLPSSSHMNASGTKRKGHKKNQSMSSISELLTSSSGAQQTTSSFHDLSLSFVSSSGRSTALSGGATPRTGLASLSDRSSPVSSTQKSGHESYSLAEASGIGASARSPGGSSQGLVPSRERSRSAPQSNSPLAVSTTSSASEFLSPVHERTGRRHLADATPVRVVDLKDVRLLSSSFEGKMEEDFTNTNGTTSSTAIGLYDFDDVQSERLWWIFNAWRTSRESYISGKTEVSAFRHQNLKTLRMLLDAFDPQQVAVLCSGKDKPSGGMMGFDVAHIHSHTFIEDRGFVLCVGYDGHPNYPTATVAAVSTSSSALEMLPRRHHHSRVEFKVFKSIPDKPSTWCMEIPRADWYLSQQQFHDGLTPNGDAVLRTLKLFGAKLLFKILGALLLENSLVVVGSSFPRIKEVTMCLLTLLRPFRWHHTFLPFLPIPSWRFLADTLNQHVQAQLVNRPKSKMTLGSLSSEWRWGSPRTSAPSSTRSAASNSSSSSSSRHTADAPVPALEEEPPFIIGTMAETWHTCVQRLKTSSIDERSIPAYVNILNLDDIGSFTSAKSSRNAVAFPRKWRKQFLERFDKVVKVRRKIQERRLTTPSRHRATPTAMATTVRGPASSSFSMRSSVSQHNHEIAKGSKATVAAAVAADDDRCVYDAECASAFVTGLHEFYDRLSTLSSERAKKLQGKKKSSKRQEIKSWFSSTHDFDAYVDRFLETAVYQRYDADKLVMPDPSVAFGSGLSFSRSSSTTLNYANGPGGGAPRSTKHATVAVPINSTYASTHVLLSGTSLARSFGSVSSNSSFNGGHPSSTHHQL